MGVVRYIREQVERHGTERTVEAVSQAVREGKLRPESISIKGLAVEFMGDDWAAKLAARRVLRESVSAVDASSFVAITGQLLVDRIKERYQAAEFVCKSLVGTEPVTNGNLGAQTIPYLSSVVDGPSQIQPGQRYPYSQFSAQYITAPPPRKYGQICALTWEMIYSDLTSQVYEAAGGVGERVGIWQEEDCANVILGLDNNHVWNGTSYNTYLSSGAWVNTQGSTALEDWTDVNEAEQLFVNMLDPVSGKVIRVNPTAILTMPFRRYSGKRAMAATNTTTGISLASAVPSRIDAPNPLDVQYPVASTKYGYQLVLGSGVTATNAREWWFLGDFARAFKWREVYGLQTREAIPGSEPDFNQDIPYAIKASIYGKAYAADPRYAAKLYVS